jgi:GNAT superfamily N-acetyltransferase
MQPNDEAAITRLFGLYLAEYQALIETDVMAEARHLAETYRLPDGHMLVAMDGSDIVGCVGWKSFPDGACEMKRMFVDPSQRGHGIGRLLGEAVMADALQHGRSHMFLVTTTEMAAARVLYSRLGFSDCPPPRATRIGCALSMDITLAPAATVVPPGKT